MRFKPALLKGQVHVETAAHPSSQPAGWVASYLSTSLPLRESGLLLFAPFHPLPAPLLLRRRVVLLLEALRPPDLLHCLLLQGPPMLLLHLALLGFPASRFLPGQSCGSLGSCLLLGGGVRFCFLRSSRDCFTVLPHLAVSRHLGQAHHWK